MLSYLVRMFFATQVPLVIACDFLLALGIPLYYLSTMKCFYDALHKSKAPIDFSRKSEAGRVYGVVGVMLMATLLTYLNVNLRWILCATILACFVNMTILIIYFSKDKKGNQER